MSSGSKDVADPFLIAEDETRVSVGFGQKRVVEFLRMLTALSIMSIQV